MRCNLDTELLEPNANAVLGENSEQRPVVVRRDPSQRRTGLSVDLEHLRPPYGKIHDGGWRGHDVSLSVELRGSPCHRNTLGVRVTSHELPCRDGDPFMIRCTKLEQLEACWRPLQSTGSVQREGAVVSRVWNIFRAFCVS